MKVWVITIILVVLFLQISSSVSSRPLGKPMVKYVANMHGDEAVGRQLMVYLADYLLDQFGKDSRVNNLLNKLDIHIIPSMNPDGFEASLVSVFFLLFSLIYEVHINNKFCDLATAFKVHHCLLDFLVPRNIFTLY